MIKQIRNLLIVLVIASACTYSKANTKKDNTELEDKKSNVQHLNLETFKDKVWDFENSPEEWKYKGDKPCIIDFYANWCGPCKQIAPIMEELAVKYKGKINIYKVNTDKEQALSRVFGIRSIPTVFFSPMDGQPMKKTGALNKEAYIKLIEELLLK